MAPHARAAEPRIFYGWWVAVAFSLIIFLSTGVRFAVGSFLKPVVGDLGIDRGTFSLVVSLSLFLYGVFVPLLGLLVDRWGSRVVCAIGTAVIAVSMGLTSPALTADIFGRFSVGSIFGLVFLLHQVGAALGSWLAGFLFDVSGGYGFAFAIACGLLLVGAGLSLTIDVNERPVRRELQPVAGGR